MRRHKRTVIAAAGLIAVLAAGWLYRSVGQEAATPAGKTEAGGDDKKPETPELAAVRKTADAFARAFNAGDARAVASFWTKEGEYVGPDEETIHGRDEIEKVYTDFFKKNPKTKVAVTIETVRMIGSHTALEEGMLKLTLPGATTPEVSRYSVLHVRGEDGWKMATVREWIPDPASLITVQDLAWLIGDWTAKGGDVEVKAHYEWDEDRVFLRCRFTATKAGKPIMAGSQVIGKNPTGGLRSWQFAKSGSFGESVWSRDGGRWVVEAGATLPDGSPASALNILIPLDNDTFTWQSMDRTVGPATLPNVPPVRVTRVKSK